MIFGTNGCSEFAEVTDCGGILLAEGTARHTNLVSVREAVLGGEEALLELRAGCRAAVFKDTSLDAGEMFYLDMLDGVDEHRSGCMFKESFVVRGGVWIEEGSSGGQGKRNQRVEREEAIILERSEIEFASLIAEMARKRVSATENLPSGGRIEDTEVAALKNDTLLFETERAIELGVEELEVGVLRESSSLFSGDGVEVFREESEVEAATLDGSSASIFGNGA